jgi:uncharacterized protein
MKTSLLPAASARSYASSRAHIRAWGFILPDLASGDLDHPLSLQPGFQTADGRLQMISGVDAVRQSIFLLLSTRPGERVMRPEYGCDLHRLVFAPNDHMTAGLAIHYVRQAVERWEPRVEILSLDAGCDPQAGERLNIMLEYRLRATLQADQLFFSLDLTGGNS